MTARLSFRSFLAPVPLIAILRGITPDEVVAIGLELVAAGFRIIEVPLNSPRPLESIERLAHALPPTCLIGAGTVTDANQVKRINDAGGQLIVMPHSDPAIVRAAQEHGMFCTPGVATPSEAFAALATGADALKMFPADSLGPTVVRAWRSVVPPDTLLFPVGGITPSTMAPFVAAGANGFGLGSALYRAGMTSDAVKENALAFVAAWQAPP